MEYLTKKDQMTQKGSHFPIFASYSTKDIDQVKPVINLISEINGVGIFFADQSLLPGDMISRKIIQHIKEAALFILFFSENANGSTYVQQEIGVALGQNKIIIPILLDGTKPTGMLADVHYLNLYDEERKYSEVNRLYKFIVEGVQKKNQNQLLGALAVLGIGYLLLSGGSSEEYDE